MNYMENKKFLAYVLVDPNTKVPRYIGITTRTLKERFAGHMNDIINRPDLNKHKTAWFRKLAQGGQIPEIKQIAEFSNLEDLKQFERDYISKYKEKYKLINQTPGGDWVGEQAHSRESILKKKTTRPIVQYNCLGEKIAEFEITEDACREYGYNCASHITSCCKRKRHCAFGYIWRYKEEELGDLSDINPNSLDFNILVMYDSNGNRIKEFNSYTKAAKEIGDNSGGSNIAAVCRGLQKNCKGYNFQLEPKYVYFDTELYKNKVSTWHIPEHQKQSGIAIDQYDLNDNFIKRWVSISEASEKVYGTRNSRPRIKQCCEGKRESFKGYKWKISAL